MTRTRLLIVTLGLAILAAALVVWAALEARRLDPYTAARQLLQRLLEAGTPR